MSKKIGGAIQYLERRRAVIRAESAAKRLKEEAEIAKREKAEADERAKKAEERASLSESKVAKAEADAEAERVAREAAEKRRAEAEATSKSIAALGRRHHESAMTNMAARLEDTLASLRRGAPVDERVLTDLKFSRREDGKWVFPAKWPFDGTWVPEIKSRVEAFLKSAKAWAEEPAPLPPAPVVQVVERVPKSVQEELELLRKQNAELTQKVAELQPEWTKWPVHQIVEALERIESAPARGADEFLLDETGHVSAAVRDHLKAFMESKVAEHASARAHARAGLDLIYVHDERVRQQLLDAALNGGRGDLSGRDGLGR